MLARWQKICIYIQFFLHLTKYLIPFIKLDNLVHPDHHICVVIIWHHLKQFNHPCALDIFVVSLSDPVLPVRSLLLIYHEILLFEHGHPLPLEGMTLLVLLANSFTVLLYLLVVLWFLDLYDWDRILMILLDSSHKFTKRDERVHFPSAESASNLVVLPV